MRKTYFKIPIYIGASPLSPRPEQKGTRAMTASFALRRFPCTLAALALGVALVVGGCAGASKPGSPRADAPQPATPPAGAALNRPDCPDNSNQLPGGLAPLE